MRRIKVESGLSISKQNVWNENLRISKFSQTLRERKMA